MDQDHPDASRKVQRLNSSIHPAFFSLYEVEAMMMITVHTNNLSMEATQVQVGSNKKNFQHFSVFPI